MTTELQLLQQCCAAGRIDFIKVLLKENSDVVKKAGNLLEFTPDDNLDLVDFLMAHGLIFDVDILIRFDKYRILGHMVKQPQVTESLLHHIGESDYLADAYCFGKLEIAKILLAIGCRGSGFPLAILAAGYHSLSYLELLYEYKIDLNVLSSDGRNALDIAIINGFRDKAFFLMARGVQIANECTITKLFAYDIEFIRSTIYYDILPRPRYIKFAIQNNHPELLESLIGEISVPIVVCLKNEFNQLLCKHEEQSIEETVMALIELDISPDNKYIADRYELGDLGDVVRSILLLIDDCSDEDICFQFYINITRLIKIFKKLRGWYNRKEYLAEISEAVQLPDDLCKLVNSYFSRPLSKLCIRIMNRLVIVKRMTITHETDAIKELNEQY